MTSIIISSDSQELCQAIGEKTAEALGTKHVDRSFLEQVAAHYEISQEKLERVLDPATARRFSTQTRNMLFATIESMTLREFENDDIVCTGLAAHLYVRDISHVLMVRVLSDSNELTTRLASTSGASPRKVQRILQRDRVRSARWSIDNFGIDELDPSIYDMILSVGQIEVEKLVHMITDLAGYRKFKAMTYSQNRLSELRLASEVLVALLPGHPDVRVRVAGTRAIVYVRCSKRTKSAITAQIKETTGQISGIESVEVHATSSVRELGKAWRTTRSS